MRSSLGFLLALSSAGASAQDGTPIQRSGIYPHLAMFNEQGECGTGAVVPFADRLWVVTYAPHRPRGSDDKLYEITRDLRQIVRPESIGGTPANRLIHRESNQLFLGPYAIDAQGNVRVIPYDIMFGRPTGTARDLRDPAHFVLTATMEEGLYAIDVRTLAVRELWADEQKPDAPHKADLPGYHGKGFYSGQGVYVYANNGEHGDEAQRDPNVPSGVLAEWDGVSDAWTVVRRNQFTEVTGPGGIRGNAHPETDPIWTIGWDAKSLLLGVREPVAGDGSPWTFYRLPKGSHSYDGAHGWNTEWPRIREVGDATTFLMTMHGTFWDFPATFGSRNARGIRPRSNYLKVIGDFCAWQGRVVFGCDDTAKNEFLNKRRAKGEIAAPQSQSNLWFVEPERLDDLGPALGRGAVWLREPVAAGSPSDPMLFAGYDHRGLHLEHAEGRPITFLLEVDRRGDGTWSTLRSVDVGASGYGFVRFGPEEPGEWIRVRCDQTLGRTSAVFTYRERDVRTEQPDPDFEGLARAGTPHDGGVLRARGGNERTLSFACVDAEGADVGYYELDGSLLLRRREDERTHAFTKEHAAIPADVLAFDEASVLFTDDAGRRWRLPRTPDLSNDHGALPQRVAREVATERDLFHAHGTFYELPAENAGGFAKVRPITTHGLDVTDFCSYRGLFVMSGLSLAADTGNEHVVRSDDGRTALWIGAIDDVWALGKPRGVGGPWRDTQIVARQPSDPYLMTGYDHKRLTLRAADDVRIAVQVDLTGEGTWATYRTFDVSPDHPVEHAFDDAFGAYWIRFLANRNTRATAWLVYE
ncbi:MAG: hypothetical protein H6834_18030 [Planctomycetes bacterium]|nr:hypothetical protein [Planctomycetota bacterium]